MNPFAALFFGIGIFLLTVSVLEVAVTLGWGWCVLTLLAGLGAFAMGGALWDK